MHRSGPEAPAVDAQLPLAALRALPAAAVVIDRDTRIVIWNDAASRLLGWSADEMLGQRPPFAVEDAREEFLRARMHGDMPAPLPDVVVAHRRKDGARVDLDVKSAPVRDALGRVEGMVLLLAPVTDAAHAETERARRETNFRALIEHAPDAIVVHRLGFIVYANPRAAALLGYERDEDLIGVRVLSTIHPDDRPAVLERMRQVADEGRETSTREVRQLRRDGTVVHTEVMALPVVFDGQPATLAHARDITRDKELAAQLRMNDRLASVGRLAAGVGHEINNPLTYVICNLDAVDGTLDAVEPGRARAVKELLADVRHGVERVRGIARDLAILSRAETDDRSFVDVRRVLDMCGNMAAHEVKHRARLIKAYDDVPLVMSNEPRLAQIFLNLIMNAAQAIAPGDVAANSITLRTRATESHVVVEVVDTGSGIAPTILDRVFDPFFTTKGVGAGTGLGLSICQGLIGALGGLITLESDGRHGTTARVMHPIAR